MAHKHFWHPYTAFKDWWENIGEKQFSKPVVKTKGTKADERKRGDVLGDVHVAGRRKSNGRAKVLAEAAPPKAVRARAGTNGKAPSRKRAPSIGKNA
jgi:hypothetical protein